MPSMVLQNVFNDLPELQTFVIDNVDDFNQEAFTVVFSKLVTYHGLRRLGLALVVFELETNKEAILQVMKVHHQTLTHISFAKNKVTNTFMQFLGEALSEMS